MSAADTLRSVRACLASHDAGSDEMDLGEGYTLRMIRDLLDQGGVRPTMIDAPAASHPSALRAALDEVRACDEAALDNLDAMLDVAGREATWGTLPATARALRAVAALVRAARAAEPAPHPGDVRPCGVCGALGFVRGGHE